MTKLERQLYEALISCVDQIKALCSEADVPEAAKIALKNVQRKRKEQTK